MSTVVKVILIVGVCLILLIVVAVGAGVYWWSQNKQALFAAAEQSQQEGRDFGEGVEQMGCMTESLARFKKEQGMGNAIASRLFLAECLKTSQPTEGFCESVPAESDFRNSAAWRQQQCESRGLVVSYCGTILAQVQQFCHSGPVEAK